MVMWFALFIVEGTEVGVVTTCVPWLVIVPPLLDKPLLLVVVPTALILLPR